MWATSAYLDLRRRRLVVALRMGIELVVPIKILFPLPGCRVSDAATMTLSRKGYFIHWPRLGAYLWIGDLLALSFRCELLAPRLSRPTIGAHARRQRTEEI